MSRQETGQGAALMRASQQVRTAFRRFQESRLYVQVILSLGLVGATGIVAAVPKVEPLNPVRRALTWTVTEDYDFVGKAKQAQAWARTRGGWGPAVSGVWSSSLTRAKDWGAQKLPGMRGGGGAAGDRPVWPVRDAVILRGFAWLPPALGDEVHEALDLGAPAGTQVVAVADGTVKRVAEEAAWGTVIEVDHGVVIALYGQVDKVAVKPGDAVEKGEPLAVIGVPVGGERSLEPHLHLEMYLPDNRKRVDPALFLGLGGTKS